MPSSVKRTLSGSSLQRRGRGKRSVERRRRSLPETDESPFSPTGTAEEEPPAAVVFDAGASGGPIPSSTPPRPSPSGSWNFAAPAPPPLSTSSLESRSNSTSGLPSSRRSYENLAEVSPASAAANNALMLRSSSRNSSGSWSGMLWEAPPSPPSQPSPPPSAAVVSLSTENPLMLPTMMGTSPPIISVLKTASEACDTESVGNLSVSFAPAAGELEPFVPHKNRERVSKQGGSKGATKKKATKIGISFRERIQSGVAPPPRKKIARRSTSQKRNSFSGTGILRRSSTSSLNGSRRSSSASRQRNNGFIILSYMAVFCVRVVSVIKRKRAAEIFQSTTGPRAAFIIQCAWRRKAQRERVHRAETVIFLVAWLRFRLRHLRFAKEKSALLLQRVFRGERDRQFHQYLYDHMYRSRGIDFIRRRVMCLEAAKVLCHLRMERDERNVMHQDCAMTSMRLLREERREWMELMCHACHVLGRQAVYTENDWAAQVMACTGASPYVTSTHDEEHDRYSPVDPSQLSPSPVDEEQPTITTLSAVPAPHVGHSKHHIPANTAPRFSSKSDDTSSTYSLPQRGALREERSSQLSEWSSRGESPQEHNPLVAGGRGYRYNAVPRHERRSSDSQRNRQLYYYSSSSSSNGDVLFFGLAEEDMQLDSATLPAAMRQTASSKVFLDSVQLESSLLQDSPPKTATALHGVSPTCFNVPSLLETPQGAATYLRALFSFESSRYLHSGVTRRVSVSFPVSSPDEAGAVPTHKTPAERQEGGGEMVGSQLLSPLTIGAGHTGGQVAQFGINSGRCADPILMEFLRLLERTESIERRQLQQELLDAHHAFLLPVSAINQAIALSPSVPPIFAPLLLAMRDGFFLRRAVALLQEEQLCRLVIIEDYEAIPLHCLNRPLVNKVAEERRRRLLRRAQDAACPLAEAEAREGAFFDQLTTLVEEVEQAGGMEGCRVVASSVDPAEATITLLGQRRAEGNKAARKCRFRVQMAPVLPPSAMELIPVSPATTAVGSSTTAAATSGMAPPVHAPRSMSTSHEGTAVSPSKEDRPPHDEMLGEMVEVGEGSGGGGGEDADSFLAGASSASSATVILPPWEAPLRSQSSGEPQVLTDSSMIPGSVVQQQQQLGAVQEEVLEEAPPLFVVPDRLHNGPPVPMLRVLHPQDGPTSRRHHLRASNAPTAEIESVERVQLECSHSGADFQQRASIPMPVVDGAAVSVPATLEEVPAGSHNSAAFGAGSPLHHPVSPLPNPYSLDSFNGVAASATDDETPLPATTPAAGMGKGGPGSPRGLPPLPPTRAAYGTSRLRPLVEQSVEAVAEEAHHRTTPLVTRAEELAWDGTRPKSEGGRSTNSLATATAATAAAPPARPPPTPPPRQRVVAEAQHLELDWDEAEVVAGPAPMLTSVSAPEWHTPELLGESERHSSRGATSLLLPPIRLSRDQRAPPPFASAVL